MEEQVEFRTLLKGTGLVWLLLSPLIIILLIWQGESQAYEVYITDYIKVYFGAMGFVCTASIGSYYLYRFTLRVGRIINHLTSL